MMSKSEKAGCYVLLLTLFSGGWGAQGRSIGAASASREDVGSAVGSAQEGDSESSSFEV